MDRTKLMATLCVAVMLSAGCCVYHANVVEEDEPADAIAPVIVGLVILNGILVGYITASKLKEYINSDKDKTPGGTDRALRINQAEAVTVNLANALSHDAAYAGDEPALVAFTSSYFQRMGELAAAEQWAAGTTLDTDKILTGSRAYLEFNTYLLNRENILNTLFDPIADQPKTWKALSTYSSMQVSLTAGGDTYAATKKAVGHYCMGMVPAAGSNECYIYNGDETKSGFVYTSAPTVITGMGKTYTTVTGYNSTGSWEPGIYKVAPGGLIMGSITQTWGASHGEVHPACVLEADNDLVYVLDTPEGRKATHNGTTTTIDKMEYKVVTDSQIRVADLSPGLSYMRTLSSAANKVYADTVNAAATAWQVYNTAGKASIFASPSMLMPNLDNMNLTADQSYLIYMSALQQMSDYYKTATDNFTADKVKISTESLELVCRGSIYTDGTKAVALASNVEYTPLCYSRDQTLIVGDTVYNQGGLAMIWAEAPDGQRIGGGLIVLENGSMLSIDSMTYRGQQLTQSGDKLVLKVTSLPDMDHYKVVKPPKPVTPTPERDIIKLVVLIIGIIVLAYGALSGRPEMIIAGILIVLFVWLGWPYLAKWGILR